MDFVESPEHRARRAARLRQQVARPRPWSKKRLVIDLVVLVAAVALGLAVAGSADIPNPAYPEPREIADRIHDAWLRVVVDDVGADEAAEQARLRAYTYDTPDRTITVITHPEPTAAGTCYAVRFGPGIGERVGVLDEPTDGCTPRPPGVLARSGTWHDVLPSERITPVWFIPLVVLLSAVGVAALVDGAVQLLERRSHR